MTRLRLWIAILLAGAALAEAVQAQQSSGGSSGGSSGTGTGAPAGGSSAGSGATESAPSGTTGSAAAPAAETPPASSSAGAASSFGSPGATPATTPTPASGADTGTGTGGGGGATKPSEPVNFTVPGIAGKPSETLTVGTGRLAKPKFRFFGSIGIGFDDNIFGAPTHGFSSPERRMEVVVSPAVPAHFEQQVTFVAGGIGPGDVLFFQPRFRNVFVPFRPAVTQEVVIPAVVPQTRDSSFVERANVGTQVQFASRRTLLTLDLRLGAENTDAKPRDQPEITGSMGLSFVHKFSGRLQWNAGVDGVYGSQPDLSRINAPGNVTGGSYLDLIARTGLQYRWTPRITTSASVTYHQLSYSQATEQSGDFTDLVFSADARYLFTPRFTMIGEVRYGTVSYTNSMARDSSSTYFLLGGDWIFNRRTTASVHAGAVLRQSQSGQTSASPYLESNVGYRLGRASVLQWNSRYGFEEPGNASSKVLTLRTGLNYIYYFTPRLRATASGTLLYSTTSDLTTGDSVAQTTFDSALGFEYNIDRRWTLTGSYNFTTLFSDNSFADYYRNRLFLGLQYQF